jgi:flagellar assembly protein FliH
VEVKNLSNIIKKNNVTHLLKIYFEEEDLSDSVDKSFFSSLSSRVTNEENNARQKEEDLLNFYKNQAETYKKEMNSLKKALEESAATNQSLGEKLKITEEELRKIREDEAKIFSEAKETASCIINDAKIQEEKIRLDAYNQGFETGKTQSEKQCNDIYLKKFEELEKVIASIKDMGNNLIVEYEAKLIQLVLTLAKTIVKKEVDIDSSIVKDCIKNALEDILDKSMVVIHINPDDYNIINEYLAKQFKTPGSPEIILSRDDNIHRGGALIESKMGVIDVTMQTRWEILEKILDKALIEKTSLSLYH